MPKSKKMPGTKDQAKYIGPLVAQEVTDTHVILDRNKKYKSQKVPIEIARLYHPRSEPTQGNKRKKTDLPSTVRPLKKPKTTKVNFIGLYLILLFFG